MMPDLEPGLIVELLHQSMENGRSPFLNVISDSMSPLIRSGDQVQVAPVSHKALHLGDVIVFSDLGELVTHRFWGITINESIEQLITKGDRPQHFDQLHDTGTLIGLVIGRRRNRRFLKLSMGAGRWLNLQLTRLATLDIRLFSKAIRVSSVTTSGKYDHDGVFADTSRDNFGHLMVRRFIYILAKMASFIALLFDETMKDT
jgi:hypothetical protein